MHRLEQHLIRLLPASCSRRIVLVQPHLSLQRSRRRSHLQRQRVPAKRAGPPWPLSLALSPASSWSRLQPSPRMQSLLRPMRLRRRRRRPRLRQVGAQGIRSAVLLRKRHVYRLFSMYRTAAWHFLTWIWSTYSMQANGPLKWPWLILWVMLIAGTKKE